MKNAPGMEILLRSIEEGYRARSWHGTNLKGSLRGISPAEAAGRPGRGRHSIWEIAVHCAYWKYAVRRRLLGEKRGSFPLEGSNWFARPAAPTAAAWRRDLALLDAMHRALIGSLAGLEDADLGRTPKGSTVSNRSLLAGIAMHDVYHAGQIQLIKRIVRS